MNHLSLVIFPLLFLAMIIFILQSVVDNSAIEAATQNLIGNGTEVWALPDFPTWNVTYATSTFELIPSYTLWNMTVNGGFFSGGADINWLAVTPAWNVPDGLYEYLGDWMAAGGQWFIDMGETLSNLLILIAFYLIPPTEVSEIAFGALIAVYAFLYALLGFGIVETFRKWIGALMP